MPGVPSGRGCEACKKQKKKCDQLKPACSRCARLKIECRGAGEQRYMFKDQTVVLRAKEAQKRRAGAFSGKLLMPLSRSPVSETMTLTTSFIATLGTRDLRYDVHIYGDFLGDVPRRLGSNDALDASVNALTSAYPCLCSGTPSVEALSKYVRAIKTLRIAMSEPSMARRPDTMCAVYLMIITQTWIGRQDDQKITHGEALSHLLGAASLEELQNEFQRNMLFAFCIPVIFESMVDPRIRFPDWFWDLAKESYGPPNVGAELTHSLSLPKLVSIPFFIRHPESQLIPIQLAYEQMCGELNSLRKTIQETENLKLSSEAYLTLSTYVKDQIALGFLLCLAIILNAIVQAFNPYDTSLAEDCVFLFGELLSHADTLACWRPLGSDHVSALLLLVWCATENHEQRLEVESRMLKYDIVIEELPQKENLQWLRRQLMNLRWKHLP